MDFRFNFINSLFTIRDLSSTAYSLKDKNYSHNLYNILCLILLVPILSLGTISRAYAGTPTHSFTAWISPDDVQLSLSDLKENAGYFSAAQVMLYQANCQTFRPYGNSTPSATSLVPQIHSYGVKAILTIHGLDNAAQAISCWNNPTTLQHHVNMLAQLAQSSGADGIDIDYESAYFDAKPDQFSAMRQGYSSLMSNLCGTLHTLNKLCGIAVIPTKDGKMYRGGGHAPFIFDYATLASICDQVEIMAYDEHTRNGTPGPIAGLPWVNTMARYAARTIPASKVWFGIPLYGRDWQGNNGTTVKYPMVKPLFAQSDVHPTYNAEQGEVTFKYGGFIQHEVWYPNYSSLSAEVRLINYYGFHPIFWSLGQEMPGIWKSV